MLLSNKWQQVGSATVGRTFSDLDFVAGTMKHPRWNVLVVYKRSIFRVFFCVWISSAFLDSLLTNAALYQRRPDNGTVRSDWNNQYAWGFDGNQVGSLNTDGLLDDGWTSWIASRSSADRAADWSAVVSTQHTRQVCQEPANKRTDHHRWSSKWGPPHFRLDFIQLDYSASKCSRGSFAIWLKVSIWNCLCMRSNRKVKLSKRECSKLIK